MTSTPHDVSSSQSGRGHQAHKSKDASDKEQHFFSLLKDFKFAMLTTHAKNGTLHARPMVMAESTEKAEIFLLSSAQSEKIDEMREDARVNLSMQDGSKFVALSGKGEVVRDPSHVKRLWNEAWRVWFPKGPEDTGIVLIKVRAQHGEYWDVAGASKAKYLYEAAKAYVTGTTPTIDKSLGGKVDMH